MTVTSEAMPRVAHLLRPAQGGMREVVRALLACDTNAPLLLAPTETLEALSDTVPDGGRRHVLAAESAAPHHQIAAGQAAGRWAKRHGAALLHAHGLRFAPLFASASLASGLPLVITLHNMVPDDLTPMQRAAARAAFSRAGAVIAVSEAIAHSAVGIVSDRERVQTIHNGIDVRRFDVPDEERALRRAAARERLGVSESAPLVLCVSRLSPEKDVANVLEAASLALLAIPDARLFIAGEGRMRKTLETQIELLGLTDRVVLLGAVLPDAVPDLLFAADVFALGSREEGLSLAVLEAAAAGIPSVATNVGGLPEAITHGVTGLLVPARDPGSFARALSTLLREPEMRAVLGAASRRHACTKFTRESMVAATQALYRRVAAR